MAAVSKRATRQKDTMPQNHIRLIASIALPKRNVTPDYSIFGEVVFANVEVMLGAEIPFGLTVNTIDC